MARETRDIAYPIAFIGFILLVMTILVIDPDRMNGLTLAKYFWFYSTLLLTGVITFGLAFYSMSIASIDITNSIMIGISIRADCFRTTGSDLGILPIVRPYPRYAKRLHALRLSTPHELLCHVSGHHSTHSSLLDHHVITEIKIRLHSSPYRN